MKTMTMGFVAGAIAAVGVAASIGCSSSSTSGSGSSGASGSSGTPGALYTRLGGHAGIRKAINAIVAEELKDPEIAAFFGKVGTPGHPTASQIEECLTIQLGQAAGGPETYPAMAEGFQCRSMSASHAGLHIPASSFDKFVTIAAGVLKSAGVADADITTIGGVLNSTKTDIVDTAAAADAGGGG